MEHLSSQAPEQSPDAAALSNIFLKSSLGLEHTTGFKNVFHGLGDNADSRDVWNHFVEGPVGEKLIAHPQSAQCLQVLSADAKFFPDKIKEAMIDAISRLQSRDGRVGQVQSNIHNRIGKINTARLFGMNAHITGAWDTRRDA